MIKVIDTPRIKQYALWANIASIGGMVLLLISVLLPLFLSAVSSYSWVVTIIGIVIAMVGIYYANRWIRKPRPEEQINKVCKGLGDTYAVFHYPHLPIDHIILTPYSIFVIEAVAYQGMFKYKDGKWKEDMSIGRAIRYIVEEHLGNPSRTVISEVASLQGKLAAAQLPNIPVKGLVVFTHPDAQIEVKDCPVTVCRIEKLRKIIETTAPKKMTPDEFWQVCKFLKGQTLGGQSQSK